MNNSLIQNIHQKLIDNEVSCVELTNKYLDKIEKQNYYFNTYITITRYEALRQATHVDNIIKSNDDIPLLAGIPMTLKDNIYTKGIRTTCSSRMLYNFVPSYDATVYHLLKKQATVLLGKTNADEFSMGGLGTTSYFGCAINPCNHNCFPGGSSSGGCAAVSANQAVFALGSDTGGSLRIPATFCGDVALKPTYGAVSRNGLIVYSIGYDQIGPITSTVTDNAIVFDCIARQDKLDPTTALDKHRTNTFNYLGNSIKGLTIGIIKECTENLDKYVEKSFNEAIEVYKKLGAKIVYVSIPQIEYCLSIYKVLSNVQAFLNMRNYDGRYIKSNNKISAKDCSVAELRKYGFGDTVKLRMMFGAYILDNIDTRPYYHDAITMQKDVKNTFNRILDSVDVLVTPTSPVTAIRKNDSRLTNNNIETDKFTVPSNIAGLPALSIPCGYDKDGLPIGLQIIGKRFCEHEILNIGYQFEQFTEQSFINHITSLWF